MGSGKAFFASKNLQRKWLVKRVVLRLLNAFMSDKYYWINTPYTSLFNVGLIFVKKNILK